MDTRIRPGGKLLEVTSSTMPRVDTVPSSTKRVDGEVVAKALGGTCVGRAPKN